MAIPGSHGDFMCLSFSFSALSAIVVCVSVSVSMCFSLCVSANEFCLFGYDTHCDRR